jgi:CRP-like cAMP-binding protein
MPDSSALAAHPLVAGFAPSVLALLAPLARERDFAAGAYLMKEGDPAECFFLVRAGAASLEVHAPGKETIRVATAGPGDVVGLSWMFPPARVHLDARALEPLRTFAFDARALRAAMDAYHDLGYALSRRLLRVTYDRLERVRQQRLDVYR